MYIKMNYFGHEKSRTTVYHGISCMHVIPMYVPLRVGRSKASAGQHLDIAWKGGFFDPHFDF